MSPTYKNKDGLLIKLSPNPIATPGGEGAIYDVLNDLDIVLVAKIYHTPQIATERQGKIEFMVANSPIQDTSEEIQNAIVWPVEALYENERFVGFTMPKVEGAITLKSLTLPQNPSKKYGVQWAKFDHNQRGSHARRLAIVYNLANAVHTIHQKGNYVIVDLKPENVFVKSNGNIALIDLDSIQINNPNVRFPAKVYTEEFAPPELHKGLVNHKGGTVDATWDYFSFAVIAYELLFGLHPFQASHQKYTTRPELIKLGYFVHGNKANKLHVIPPVHRNYTKLSAPLQQLFHQTLEQGHLQTSLRANMNEWTNCVYPLLNTATTLNTQIVLAPTKRKKTIAKPNKKTTDHWAAMLESQKDSLFAYAFLLSTMLAFIGVYACYFMGLLKGALTLLFVGAILFTIQKKFPYTLSKIVKKPSLKEKFDTIGVAFLFVWTLADLIFRPIGGFPVSLVIYILLLPAFVAIFSKDTGNQLYHSAEQFESFLLKQFGTILISILIPLLLLGSLLQLSLSGIYQQAKRFPPQVIEQQQARHQKIATPIKSKETYGLGTSKETIIRIQGEPELIRHKDNQEILVYGTSTIVLEEDKMVAFENSSSPKLNIKLNESIVNTKPYFTIGSTKDDVIDIQGTPFALKRFGEKTVFEYGTSKVYIKNNKVYDFYNSGRPSLKVEAAINHKARKNYFTLGSHKDLVLRLHGEPDKKEFNHERKYSKWYYGKNWVGIKKGQVVKAYHNKHQPLLNIK